jgi:hypothetical protein
MMDGQSAICRRLPIVTCDLFQVYEERRREGKKKINLSAEQLIVTKS